jgi:cation transport ATPase
VKRDRKHPLAAAVLKKVAEKFPQGIPDPEFFESFPGKGVHAVYRGHDLIFETPEFSVC